MAWGGNFDLKTCFVRSGKGLFGWLAGWFGFCNGNSELGECYWVKFNKIQFHSGNGKFFLGIQLGFILNGSALILLFVGNSRVADVFRCAPF